MGKADELLLRRLGLKGRNVKHALVATLAGADRAGVTKYLHGDPKHCLSKEKVRKVDLAVDLILQIQAEDFVRDRDRYVVEITRAISESEQADFCPDEVPPCAAAQ